MPAAPKVWLKVKPLVCSPESHRLVSLVVECEVAPEAQVHLTWSFTLIVTVAGLKEKLTMLTFAVAARAFKWPARPAVIPRRTEVAIRKGTFFRLLYVCIVLPLVIKKGGIASPL